MGEMAEAMIDGIFDQFGEYVGDGYDYRERRPASRFLKKSSHPRKEKFSTRERLFGILKVIYFRVKPNTGNFVTCEKCHDVMKEYVENSLGLKVRKRRKLEFCTEKIEEDFNRFMAWLNENYPSDTYRARNN